MQLKVKVVAPAVENLPARVAGIGGEPFKVISPVRHHTRHVQSTPAGSRHSVLRGGGAPGTGGAQLPTAHRWRHGRRGKRPGPGCARRHALVDRRLNGAKRRAAAAAVDSSELATRIK